ncbi:hypothetical protein [Pseudomonas sp. NFX15]|uniref:hypothetical protein n=1 Tax=Pseudomonas sp. NFX15 TaxID=2816958 RepID=UPI003B8B9E3D
MTNDLLKEVSKRLAEVYRNMGFTIDVDDTYLTSWVVNDQGKQVIDYSESLSWAIMEKVQINEVPHFEEAFAGVYSKRWTMDRAYQLVVIDLIDVNNVGRVVVESFRR